jgi:hypothetical protein
MEEEAVIEEEEVGGVPILVLHVKLLASVPTLVVRRYNSNLVFMY